MDFASAVRSRDYWLITGTFFVCGFHVSFLLAHMPGVIESCGLPAGMAGTWLAIVGAFLLMPKSAEVMLVFSVWMGVTYMATLPPTTGLIAACFGTRHMGKLFGVTMLLHQVGAFLGVWLGGVSVEATGGYELAWQVDAGLALLAVAMSVGIAERGRTEARQAVGLPADRASSSRGTARPTPLRTGAA